ncbi:MAG: MarR family winged helix-turn-helix transcriptional regulator [Alphaproteobacteria bacterium]|nr:MarR family winged helix-turn-helix transcriptional regulator [Alphaproteobacteria bacterium]
MQYKEFTQLMADNIILMSRLGNNLHSLVVLPDGYSKQQILILVRLYIGGKAKLKDIASREFMSTANLCSLFRKMEQLNLVARDVDDKDRRDTWYSLTKYGQNIAKAVIDKFLSGLENIFSSISKEDEKALTDATKTINALLKKMEC